MPASFWTTPPSAPGQCVTTPTVDRQEKHLPKWGCPWAPGNNRSQRAARRTDQRAGAYFHPRAAGMARWMDLGLAPLHPHAAGMPIRAAAHRSAARGPSAPIGAVAPPCPRSASNALARQVIHQIIGSAANASARYVPYELPPAAIGLGPAASGHCTSGPLVDTDLRPSFAY